MKRILATLAVVVGLGVGATVHAAPYLTHGDPVLPVCSTVAHDFAGIALTPCRFG